MTELKILKNLEIINTKNPENNQRLLQIELPPGLTEEKYRLVVAKLLQDEKNKKAPDLKTIGILESLLEAKYNSPKN
ncbi:MAG: hypothetical protein WC678_01735 [Parcubacteria group bacterium]|jgi:hypothetical protein